MQDERLEALSDRVVDAIVNKYWNPEYRLMNEVLAHDYTRPDDTNESFIYLGHAIETLWILLPEALRRGDRALFEADCRTLSPSLGSFLGRRIRQFFARSGRARRIRI